MKTEMKSTLVAIEEETLETVAGGFGGFAAPSFDLDLTKFDLDVQIQKNEAIVAGNAISSYGDVVIAVTQSNQG